MQYSFCKMSAHSWSSKNSGKSSGRYYVFAGRAYGRVTPGSNPTLQITSDRRDRERFYRDPAVTLSDADLDAFNGTEGSPLCVEHDTSDVVGVVHHSWLGDGDGRSLKIIGRISLDTARGRAVAEEVRAGRYKGLSVGYSTEIDGNNHLHEKRFREISLVADPFFESCQLASYGVTASKDATNIAAYNSKRAVFELQIQASSNMADPETMATTTTTTSGSPVPAEELLRQTDQLKSHLEEERKQREAMAQRVKDADERLARYEAKEAQEAAAYAESQKPKAEAYIEALTASRGGKPLPEKMAQGYRETFCDVRYKEAAQELEAQGKGIVELMASKKTAEERAAAAEAQAKTYQSAVTKTSEILNHSRSDFAAALQPKDGAEDAARRKAVVTEGVTASGLALNHIMIPEPSVNELPFLKAYGYTAGQAGVTASALAPGERALPRSIPVAASHRLIKDADSNPRHPASWRYTKGSDAMFSWMCSQDELRSDGGDLSEMVNLVASKDMYLRKAADPLSGLGQ
jgi:hypothetical protein